MQHPSMLFVHHGLIWQVVIGGVSLVIGKAFAVMTVTGTQKLTLLLHVILDMTGILSLRRIDAIGS